MLFTRKVVSRITATTTAVLMATTYTANLTISCQKQHTCLGCRAEYFYLMERKIAGTGGTEAAAATNAEAAAIKSIENDVDQHACPHCGMMQPDMIAEVRRNRFLAGMWIPPPIIILAAFFIALPHWMTISTSAMIATCGVIPSLMSFASGVSFNPNKDMAVAQMDSAEKVNTGELVLVKEGVTSVSDDNFGGRTGGHWFGLGLGVLALLSAASPLLLSVINGWQENGSYPSVVGTGDTTCVYFDRDIKSLKGMWYGNVTVTATTADAPEQLVGFRGKSKQSSWGDTISGKSVSNETHKMWVEVTVPNTAELAAKSVTVNMEVNARFPFEQDGGFNDTSDTFAHTQTLLLSSAGGGTIYWQSWMYGQLGAAALIFIAGLVLSGTASGLVRKANVPTVRMPDDREADIEE